MKKYPAKILLFGEHIVLNGALSLAVPFDRFYACWDGSEMDDRLMDFYNYCENLPFADKDKLSELKSIRQSFKSIIPNGYGLGSSGSLCAAVYEYVLPHPESVDDKKAIADLAAMEGFFHGKSSGMDAFTIYKNKAVLYSLDRLEVLDRLGQPFLEDLYLIDSGVSRSSKDLISKYLDNKSVIPEKMVDTNNDIVSKLIQPYEAEISDDMRALSHMQLDVFEDMILPPIKEIWKDGLASEEYYMKLCGAGGGGYYLAWGNGVTIANLPYNSIKIF